MKSLKGVPGFAGMSVPDGSGIFLPSDPLKGLREKGKAAGTCHSTSRGCPFALTARKVNPVAFRSLLASTAMGLCALPVSAARTPEADATVVVFNRTDPDSEKLAQYYAVRRDIPADHLVGLVCAPTEEISRGEYETTLAGPLRTLFQTRGWWTMGKDGGGRTVVRQTRIRFLALIRGIPLKIAHDPTIPPASFIEGLPPQIAARNEASVDSELATLGLPVPGVAGIVPNGYFRSYKPVLDNTIFPGLLLPARLDGPSPLIVRGMIDDSISTERDGLWGWAYVDARVITEGGYAEGDRWMRNVAASMRTLGLPVIFENTEPTFPAGYPVTNAAVYYGWYAGSVNGPFAEPGFQFRAGAVAVHLHSYSASTLRSATENWCGPLLAHGAAATLGNVYEPYLALTANLDVFQDRLMTGFTLAESGYMAQRALSWMGVVVGDPLYRPFAAWSEFRDPVTHAPTSWEVYRHIVRTHGGNVLQSATALRKEAEQSSDSLFLEALGTAQVDAGETAPALASFQEATALAKEPAVRRRLNLETITALQALGRKSEATALALAVSSQCAPGPRQNLFLQFLPTPTPSPTPAASPHLSPKKPTP